MKRKVSSESTRSGPPLVQNQRTRIRKGALILQCSLMTLLCTFPLQGRALRETYTRKFESVVSPGRPGNQSRSITGKGTSPFGPIVEMK